MINPEKTDFLPEDGFCELLDAILRKNQLQIYAKDDILRKFYALACILREENAKYNLTAITSDEGVALLHFADSLSAAHLPPQGASLLDVGAGAGFPSLPIAIVRPDLSITSLDATKKKTDYIGMAAKKLGLANVTALNARAEAPEMQSLRESFDFAMARAVSSLGMICELTLPYIKVGGCFAALKGGNADSELIGASQGLKKLSARIISDEKLVLKGNDGNSENTRRIISIEKLAKTSQTYPRAYAKIKKSPLF
jgi:16S rRNA (guanine527-N7)-methyltransferase